MLRVNGAIGGIPELEAQVAQPAAFSSVRFKPHLEFLQLATRYLYRPILRPFVGTQLHQ
jgi:hypothetical protein